MEIGLYHVLDMVISHRFSGGSTNAVLHLLAIAATAEIELTIDDFQRISDKTALIADLKPSGKFRMEETRQKDLE